MKMIPMSETEFTSFIKLSHNEYAEERSTLHKISFDEALQKAQSETQRLLPNGQNTKDHFFFNFKDDLENILGYLWYGIRESFGQKQIFIFDILVNGSHRGKGFGKFMMTWLEAEATRLGINEISLHVLARNRNALRLYEGSGFEPTSLYMTKRVGIMVKPMA